jgi:hypothetical protein
VTNKQVTVDDRQVTLDDWLADIFREKLRQASVLASRMGKPLVLYRRTLEESEYASEEELATVVSERFAIVQVYTQGGFIPPNVQQQRVFSLEEFPVWMMKRSRELSICCLEAIDAQSSIQ